MNKKFLSAILFGALMTASTTVFVSCEDYADDINNLQTQIDGINATIDEIKALVESGAVITNVENDGEGVKLTLSNGQSYLVEHGTDGAAGVDGTNGKDATVWTIGPDGY